MISCWPSVDVAKVALFGFHQAGVDVVTRGFLSHATLFADDVDEGLVDIFRHVSGIAADINIGPTRYPRPQLHGVLAHLVLDIYFMVLVA